MRYTKEIPSKVGWYWLKTTSMSLGGEDPRVVYVRKFAGIFAVDTLEITNEGYWKGAEWAGPIPQPGEL